MEGPPRSSTPTDPYEFTVKQEKSDTDLRSDKVIQFALQKCSEKVPITGHEIHRPRRVPIRIDYIDLTLSSDDEAGESGDRSSRTTSTSTLPIDLSTRDMDDIEREMERVHDLEPTNSQLQEPSPTVEQDDIDYEIATSAVEVSLVEMDGHLDRNQIHPSFKHRKFSKSLWSHGQGLTLPYTDEQKRNALQGNPEFDYRTKLGENGEETYAIYKCQICPTGFPRMHHYLVHMKGHGNNPGLKFSCNKCDYRTTNSAFLANHMDRHRLQREPHIFANLQARNRGNQTQGNAQKRSSELVSQENAKRRSGRSDEERRSIPDGSFPSTEPAALNLSPHVGSDFESDEACRREAREGNPNIVYPPKTYRQNGKVYKRSTYKCQQCPYNHEKYEVYLKHLDGHRKQRLYQCHLCTYSVSTQINLGRHLAGVHGKQQTTIQNHEHKKWRRLGYGRRTIPTRVDNLTSDETVRELRMSSVPTMTLQCPKCPTRFNSMGNLGIHERQHGKFELRLRCPHCDYCSSRDDYMKKHIQVHFGQNGDGGISMPSLNSEVRDIGQLITSSSPPTIRAKPRNLTYPTNVTEEVIAKMIKGNPRFTYMETSANGHALPLESSLKCWHCPYATLHYSSYLRHQKCHNSNAAYACNKCTYSAKTLQGLKNHNLVHTIQHVITRKKSVAEQDATSTSTEEYMPAESPMMSSTEGGIPRNESGKFFISSIRIQNVMPMNEEPTVADVSNHGILKLKGKSEDGKSSYILAVMLGMGYDLCLDHKDQTTSICGLNLKNVISHGKEFASIELTLSLRAFPELQQEFGAQLKFSRRINREQSELSNVLVVSSADPRPQFKSVRPKVLGGNDLKEFLQKLKLSPERMRLMLLDGENVKYLMDNTDLWFEFFAIAVDESATEIEQKIQETNFLLQRIQGEQISQQERLEVFKARLSERPPLDSEKIRQVQEEDWINHNKCTLEISELAKQKCEFQKKLVDFGMQAKDGAEGYVLRMRTMFNKFLYELNYAGEIMVSNQTSDFVICIWKIDSPEVPPTTMGEVKEIWKSMSNGRRRIAVIGLYLALWEISNYLEILAADAYSCTEADFQVPPSSLPILWELLNKKCLEQKQCIISLPPDY